MLALADLIAYIFEGKTHSLAHWLERRVKESRRFRAFADHYRGKIRGKHPISTDLMNTLVKLSPNVSD
jgi:hypothetical protein